MRRHAAEAPERRLKRLVMTEEIFLSQWTKGAYTGRRVFQGIPKGARLEDVSIDRVYGHIALTISHPSFPALDEEEEIPHLNFDTKWAL